MRSENAKNPDWKVPVNIPGVKPEDYPKDIDTANGSASKNTGKNKADAGSPDYTIAGYSSSKTTTKP